MKTGTVIKFVLPRFCTGEPDLRCPSSWVKEAEVFRVVYAHSSAPNHLGILLLPGLHDLTCDGDQLLAGLRVKAHKIEQLDLASVVILRIPNNGLTRGRVKERRIIRGNLFRAMTTSVFFNLFYVFRCKGAV